MLDADIRTNDRWVIVLDLETRPDQVTLQLAGVRADDTGRGPSRRAALHEVAAAAILTARVDANGHWSETSLRSWIQPKVSEVDILLAIDTILTSVMNADSRAILVTYNGTLHDLPVLRRRAAAHWLFDRRAIVLGSTEDSRHADLMRSADPDPARWVSLRDACSVIGLPLREQDIDPRFESEPKARRKCEVDVVATFLLFVHERALASGRLDEVALGWTALADHLDERWADAAHLRPYRSHPRLTIARAHLARTNDAK